MASNVPMPMARCHARASLAASPWTVWVPLESMANANMIPKTTRTGAAEPMPSAPMLPIMAMAVLMPTAMSNVPLKAALSLWTAWAHGVHMLLSSMTRMHTRARNAASMQSAACLPTMGMPVHMWTNTSNASQRAVLSLWTVWAHGMHMTLAVITQMITPTSAAGFTR